MFHPVEASTFFGIDLSEFWRAFVLFAATYFGSKHGSTNGNGNGNNSNSAH